ncbi:Hypothetical protein FKW44_002810 [Caligus rogercresseyi]|uniref:Uncharacterized protein n=1 Tax=Caligus rogercresseyi TaxID=217165 RepID=A0A7T8QWJ2_CALRO|nr:Hypothetical protein FKW44_002810 [Caligus rogercresseyi]
MLQTKLRGSSEGCLTTNNVECYWKNAKRRLKPMAGVHIPAPRTLGRVFAAREMGAECG